MSLLISFQRAIDRYVGAFLIFIISVFTPKKKSCQNCDLQLSGNMNILFIKLWAKGDAVNSLPLIRLVKEKTDARVSVLSRKQVEDVFSGCAFVDDVMIFENSIFRLFPMFKKYDIVFDLDPYMNMIALLSWYLGKVRLGISGQFRSRLYNNNDAPFVKTKHMAEIYLSIGKSLGISQRLGRLEKLPVLKKDILFVNNYFSKKRLPIHGRRIVMLAPGVGLTGRQRIWPAERYAVLADRLVKKGGVDVIFVGSCSDRKDIDDIIKRMKHTCHDFCDAFTAKQFFYAVTKADVFVSNDTGPMHIAAAQGVSTLGLFGPNIPQRWRPFGEGNLFLYHKLKCSPCIINEKGLINKCSNRQYQKCMRLITVNEAYDAVMRLFRR